MRGELQTVIAAAYIRVSTEEQADPTRFGVDAQRAAIEQYAAAQGMIILEEFQDTISGVSAVRPEFERLLESASKFSAVIVYDQTRLARDVEISYAFLRALQKRGLAVHSTQRGTLERGIVFGIDAIMGEEERERIKQRTHRGRIERGKRGLPPNGITAYGYTWDKGTDTASPHPEQAAIVRSVFLEAATTTTYRIAQRLMNEGTPAPGRGPHGGTAWWASTINTMLKNTIYRGDFTYGKKERITIPVPAIVTPEEWTAAQRLPGAHRGTGLAPLVGHLRCGRCGYAMSTTSSRSGRRYRCGTASHPIHENCGNTTMAIRFLDPQVEKALRQMLRNPKLMQESLRVGGMPENDKDALKLLDVEDERWLHAFSVGAVTAEELNSYRRGIAGRRELIRARQARQYDFTKISKALKGAEFKEILKALKVVVRFDRGKINIEINP